MKNRIFMKLINYTFIFFFSLLSLSLAQDDDDFEFDDDDFEFDEDEFDLEGIDEFDLEDDDFDSLLEEFELQEDEGFEEGEPRKFLLGLDIGTCMPFGQNLKPKYSNGFNIGLQVLSPFGFYFGPFEIIFGGEISYASLPGIKNETSNPDELPYSLMNIMATAKTKILFLDVKSGFGISPSSAPKAPAFVNDPEEGDKINTSLMTVVVDAVYPIDMGSFTFDIKFRAQEVLGVPGAV